MNNTIIALSLCTTLLVLQNAHAQEATKEDCSKFPHLAQYMPSCGGQTASPGPSSENELKVVEGWTRSYMQCAISTVPQVDDGVSDAQTVALALGAQCKDANVTAAKSMRISDRDDLVKHLHPRLTEVVLYHRAASKRDTQRQVKKKPQT